MDSFTPRRHATRRVIARLAAVLISIFACSLLLARPRAAASPTPEAPARASAAAKPVSAASPAPAASASAKPSALATPQVADRQEVINYLSDTISWFRHLTVEAQLVHQPDEALFYANDHQMAIEILTLAFQYARAQADLLARSTGSAPAPKPAATPLNEAESQADSMVAIQQHAESADAELRAAQDRVKQLKIRLASATGKSRVAIASQLDAAKSEVELAQARADALKTFLEFASGTAKVGSTGSTLSSQIDELEQSVPEAERASGKRPTASGATPIASLRPAEATGIVGYASSYFALEAKAQTLKDTAALTDEMAARVERLRAPLIKILRGINARGTALAREGGTGDVARLKWRKQQFEVLLDLHKGASAALLPLSKQALMLGLYRDNLDRWRASVERRASGQLRNLVVRLIGLLATLAVIAAGAFLWRFFAIRFVADPVRRHQVMQVRRIALWAVVALVILFDFANEIGSIATVLGLAAAGIALALQNVILSVAGFFFLIGRYGIKAGDRVTIGGVTGDVIDIGLVKLSLLELSGKDRLPTGRVVVFSNAVVFQPSGNFSKQAPGTSFIWNELHLMLSPDCDYRLAEKLVLDATDEVYARYRDRVQREHRHLGSDLNRLLETPRPQSRLTLTPAGLEMTVRYPAEMRSATQIGDEVSRRVLDAVQREPGLKLIAQTTANIQGAAAQGEASADGQTDEPSTPAGDPAAAAQSPRSAKS
jgi:small-conductance mechanosensitive channel